jgi:glycosyltransferase involved in cell wall biosynthesis
MNRRPLVSIVIDNYNYGRFLGEAIDSALGQRYSPVEVIVVDDGSTDNSESVLKRYAGRIHSFRGDRRGVAAARNYGVQSSRGELVAFLDADDMWLPNKLEQQVARFLAEPDLGLINCGLEEVDENERTLQFWLDGLEGWISKLMLLPQRGRLVATGSISLLPRRTFDAVGGFDPRLSVSADWDLTYRVALQQRVGFVPEILVRARTHGANMHLTNISALEHDMLLVYSKVFSRHHSEVEHLRRKCYGDLHLALAGSFFRAGRKRDFIRHLMKSVWLTPHNVSHILAFPARAWQRRVSRTTRPPKLKLPR